MSACHLPFSAKARGFLATSHKMTQSGARRSFLKLPQSSLPLDLYGVTPTPDDDSVLGAYGLLHGLPPTASLSVLSP